MRIIEIKKITHCRIKDYNHNDISMFETDIIEITYEDRTKRYVSTFMDKDLTDIEYAEYIRTKRSKEKILMHDIDEDDRID